MSIQHVSVPPAIVHHGNGTSVYRTKRPILGIFWLAARRKKGTTGWVEFVIGQVKAVYPYRWRQGAWHLCLEAENSRLPFEHNLTHHFPSLNGGD